MGQELKKPRYDLEIYRKFIREAAPYVSIIIGRKLQPEEADTLSEDELVDLAVRIDSRVDDLKGRRH